MMKLQANDFFPSPADLVAVVKKFPQEAFPEHSHDFGEIVIINQGGGYNVVNDHARRVCAGSVCYLMPEDRHSFEEVNELCLTNVLFRMPERYLPLLASGGEGRYSEAWEIGVDTRRQVERLLASLDKVSEHFTVDLARSCFLEGVFLQLVALLCQARYSCDHKTSLDTRARELVSYLRGNFSESIDWESLAEKFSLSTRTLHRKIVDQTGLTPVRYLNQLRLTHAAQSLLSSRQGITEIAFASGFEDSNYFSTVFRQEYGESPSQYRAHHASWIS
jgi:AraC family L-rhamnose operon regulatory protein RhaS